MNRAMVLPLLLAWALSPAFSRPVRAESTPSQQPTSDSKDLCSYLKDVETKADADCEAVNLAALKAKDPVAYAGKVELARRRKPEVLKVYELLKAQTSEASQPKQSALPKLDPPINERTFPAWVGPEAKNLKEVYTRWLQAQNQELQQEKDNPVSPERRKEIDAAISKNQARIATLGKIKDPGELSCFLGEACGTRPEFSGLAVSGVATGKGSWTKAEYERANDESNRQNRVPGAKIDRGVPTMGMVASEVVSNTPLGPLLEKTEDGGGAGLGTVATVALATTGALLLFGGLGGKALEEKFPNIRRDMGIAAGVSGVVAAGALSLSTLSTALPSLPALPSAAPAVPQLAIAGGGTLGGGAGSGVALQQAGAATLKVATLVAGAKVASELYTYATSDKMKPGDSAQQQPADSGKDPPQKPTVKDLLNAGEQSDRNGLTKVGRALQKHGHRQGSAYPKINGKELNETGRETLKDIISNPKSGRRVGKYLDIISPNGRGARFTPDGKRFIGFLEP